MKDPLPSQTFGDARYEVLKALGRGSFGTVYEVLDRLRGEVLALKFLHNVAGESLYRFKQEFRLLAGLQHPNLVQLYELAAWKDEWYFTMERLHGRNFLSFVRPHSDRGANVPERHEHHAEMRPVLNVTRLRDALGQLIGGILELHGQGILHRDIKPQNVMVTNDGRVVLLDFGVALDRVFAKDIRACGTPAYMAPECLQGQWSEATDWYSVGVMLYEALSGVRPFAVRDFLDLSRTLETDVRPLPEEARAAAPELAQLCMDLLSSEPMTRPKDRELRAYLGAFAGVTARTPQGPLVKEIATPFVGRLEEMETLRDAFRHSIQTSVLVTVEGPSGIGKTALTHAFLQWAAWQPDATVLSGRCYQQESVPYKGLDSLMDALSEHLLSMDSMSVPELLPPDIETLARLFPALRRVPGIDADLEIRDETHPFETHRRAAAVLQELLRRLSERGPLVLALDDVQWGDSDSSALLRRVMESASLPRLLLLLSYRGSDTGSATLPETLLRATVDLVHEHHNLSLGPLSTSESESVARAHLGHEATPDLIRDVVQESGGNPFFVEVLSRGGRHPAEIPVRSGAPLENIILSFVEKLPGAAARFLEVLAVAGHPLTEEVTREAALDAGGGAVVRTLRAQRLLRASSGTGNRLEVYHDRIRQAILSGLDADTRKFHHRRLAGALERAQPHNHEILFLHFNAAGEIEPAVRHGVRAAELAAEKLAFDRAATLYQQVLAYRTLEPARERVVRAEHAKMLGLAGRGAEAARAYEALADEATETADALEHNRLASEQLLISGHIDEGLERLKPVLDAYGMRMPTHPWSAVLTLLWQRLRLRLRGMNVHPVPAGDVPTGLLDQVDSAMAVSRGFAIVDTVRGAAFQTLCLRLALDAGEPQRVARALTMEIGYASAYGSRDLKRGLRLYQEANRLVESGTPDDGTAAILHAARGMIHHLAEGRFREALADYDAADARLLRASGTVWELDTARLLAIDSLLYLGELKELSQRAPRLLRDGIERGDRYLSTSIQVGSGHHRWLAADSPDELRRQVPEAMQDWSQTAFSWQHYWTLWALTQADLYEGFGSAALARIVAGWPALAASQLLTVQIVAAEALHLRARTWLAVAIARSGQARHEAVAQALRDARRVERLGCAWAVPLATLIHAGAAATNGDSARAAELLNQAAAGLRAHELKLFLAAAEWRLGQILDGGQGQELNDRASNFFAQQEVKNPEAMVRLLTPGFA